MACFKSEYVLRGENVEKVDCVQIGDDIWVFRMLRTKEMELYKFNSSTKEFEQQDHKNTHLFNNEYIYDVFTGNGKIYFEKQVNRSRRVLELDPETLEWKVLSNIPYYKGNGEVGKLFICDNKVYRNVVLEMVTTSIDTLEEKVTELPFRALVSGRTGSSTGDVNYCEVNGTIYQVGVRSTGLRRVYRYDKEENSFERLYAGLVDCQVYEENLCVGVKTFLWTKNNKIYQALDYQTETFLRIDCFDVDTKQWTNLFEKNYGHLEIQSVSGTDRKVYLHCRHVNGFVIRVIDLQPSLETKLLLGLADKIVANLVKHSIATLRSKLNARTMKKLENMVAWKKQNAADVEEHRKLLLEFEDTQSKYYGCYMALHGKDAKKLHRLSEASFIRNFGISIVSTPTSKIQNDELFIGGRGASGARAPTSPFRTRQAPTTDQEQKQQNENPEQGLAGGTLLEDQLQPRQGVAAQLNPEDNILRKMKSINFLRD